MKIKTKDISFEDFINLPIEKRARPLKPSIFFRTLLKIVSAKDIKATHFKVKEYNMEKLNHKEPALFLMNHSAFIDLEIASTILYPRPFNIVCTEDGFVGKNWLLRHLGCIPTKKFVTDYHLFKDMEYVVKEKKSSILMYPEASYSFDGTATPLPESLAKCVKLLNIPVVMIRTFGAFQRDPLYNNLQVRDVDVRAEMRFLLSKDDIESMDLDEINKVINGQFEFDNFKWQIDNNVIVSEPFRADYLHRVLYKCPHCLTEGETEGKGTSLVCHHCGAEYFLEENGSIRSVNKETIFNHIPSWYKWERECVRKELIDGTYKLDIEVDIKAFKGTECLYNIGKGRLIHDVNGFHLSGCEGKPDVKVSPKAQYSLYSDYYWYEIGDMIAISDKEVTYYCFPTHNENVAANTRLAVEELSKIVKGKE